jgi:hypothetical protein
MLTVSPVRWSPGRLWFWLRACLAAALLAALLFGIKAFGDEIPLGSAGSRSQTAAASIDQSLLQPLSVTTPHSFLPYNSWARYGRTTVQPFVVETLSYVRSCRRNASSFFFFTETSRSDKAAIQAGRCSLYPVLRREFQDKAMCDSLPDLRPRASACVASIGTPGGSIFDGAALVGRPDKDRWDFGADRQSDSFLFIGEGGEPPSSGHPNPFLG